MANAESENGTILVLGGTGKTGRRVVELLRKTTATVRLGSRAGKPPFDWDNRATWAAALHGVRAAYVAFHPDFAVPGALETVRALFDQAVAHGVNHLVLLSGRGEIEAEQAEQALQASGAEWTILRSSWFCQNFSEGALLEPILAGEVALPGGLAAEPFVDVDDIAEIAVAALTEPGHAGKLYDITGPRAISFAEATGEIAALTGRDIAFTEVSPQDYRTALLRQGVPAETADLIIYLFTTVLDGRNTPLGDGVARALGRAPRDFSDYARRTAATGIWGGRHG